MSADSLESAVAALGRSGRGRPFLIVAAVLIVWPPLLILSLFDGTAFGDAVTVTFLSDYSVHGRYLIAMPLALLMDVIVSAHMPQAVQNLSASGLVRESDAGLLRGAVLGVARAWDNTWVLVALALVAGVSIYYSVQWSHGVASSHWRMIDDRTTLAGGWNFFVSSPLTRWIGLRALWKLVVWAWFLARISRWPLQLNALHPDGRCGLRFLGGAQIAFAPLVAAFGVMLGSEVALAVSYEGAAVRDFTLIAAALVVLSVLIIVGPLLPFAPRAWLARKEAENAFGAWGAGAANWLSHRLLAPKSERTADDLGAPEISSLMDASTLYDRVLATRPVPITVRQIVAVGVISMVSIALPLVTLLPLSDIFRTLAQMLL